MKLSRLIISVSKLSMAEKEVPKLTVYRKAYNQVTFDASFPPKGEAKRSLRNKISQSCACSGERLLSWVYFMFPILYWLPRYKFKRDFPPDVVAGLTVGVMHIPQGMAYSVLAGLDPVYGLYTSFFPPLIYMFLGTSRHVSLGVFAVISLMVGSVRYKHLPEDVLSNIEDLLNMNISEQVLLPDLTSVPPAVQDNLSPLDPTFLTPINIVTALTFAVGCFLGLMSIFRLGFITSYLSDQVVSGFTTGAAFHVFTAQMDKVLNVKLPRHNGVGKLFYVWHDLFSAIPQANLATVIMSALCILFLVLGKEVVNPRLKKYCSIPPPMELIIVIFTTAVSHLANFEYVYRMKVVGHIPRGLPMPSLPHVEYVPHMLGDALSISIVVFVVTVSMAKLFAKKHHYKINANQELKALGLMQMGASFFGCWTSCVSLSRSLVFESAGASTQLATLFSSALLLVVLLWLGPLFQALPTCVLASIIIVALKGMFMQLRQLKELWPVSKIDFAIWLIAFVSTVLLDITYGLGISVFCALFSVVYRTRNASSLLLGKCESSDMITDASLVKMHQFPKMKVFRFHAPLLFLNADRLRKRLFEACGMDLDDPAQILRNPIKSANSTPDKPSSPKPTIKISASDGAVASAKEMKIDLEDENYTNHSDGQGNELLVGTPAWRDHQNVGVDDAYKRPPTFPEVIILDCCAISTIDVMGLNAILELHKELQKAQVRLMFAACNADLLQMLERSNSFVRIPKTDVFPTVEDAIALYNLERPSTGIRYDREISYIKIPVAQGPTEDNTCPPPDILDSLASV